MYCPKPIAPILGAVLALVAASPGVGHAQRSPEGAANEQQRPSVSPELMKMRAGDLVGRLVLDDEARELGEVEKVVRDRRDQALSAIVSSGGVLGLGPSEVPIPVEHLDVDGERLIARIGLVRAQVQEQAKDYDEERCQELRPEQILAAATSGVDPQNAALQATFEELDEDQRGDISRPESEGSPVLRQRFDELDRDGDGAIDRSEPSAYEQTREAERSR